MRKKHHSVGAILASAGVFLALSGVYAFNTASADTNAIETADWSSILIAGGLILIIGGLLLMVFLFMTD